MPSSVLSIAKLLCYATTTTMTKWARERKRPNISATTQAGPIIFRKNSHNLTLSRSVFSHITHFRLWRSRRLMRSALRPQQHQLIIICQRTAQPHQLHRNTTFKNKCISLIYMGRGRRGRDASGAEAKSKRQIASDRAFELRAQRTNERYNIFSRKITRIIIQSWIFRLVAQKHSRRSDRRAQAAGDAERSTEQARKKAATERNDK